MSCGQNVSSVFGAHLSLRNQRIAIHRCTIIEMISICEIVILSNDVYYFYIEIFMSESDEEFFARIQY